MRIKFVPVFFLCLAGLLLLTLPYPYALLPRTGEGMSAFLGSITGAIARLLGIHYPYVQEVTSDTSGFLIYLFLLLFLSALPAAGLSFFLRKRTTRIPLDYWAYTTVSYYLALQLIIYATDKIFKFQFFFPEPNTLYTPVGQMEKGLLYWSTIGASHSYNIFLGLCELLPAALLLFRRTRMAGALLMLPVLVNVAAVNFCYDISVKMYSLVLLALNLYTLWPCRHRLLALLGTKAVAQPGIAYPEPRNRKMLLAYAGFKSLVIGLIVAEGLFKYAAANTVNGDALKKQNPLYGAYTVTSQQWSWSYAPLFKSCPYCIDKLFFHSRGYLVIKTMDEQFYDYPVEITSDSLLVSKPDVHWPFTGVAYRLIPGQLVLNDPSGAFRLHCNRLDTDSLPLARDGFHLLLDDHAR